MTIARRVRPVPALLAVLLVSVLLPLFGPTAPAAHADPGCTSEQGQLPPSFGCDDDTPPNTELTGMAPDPNGEGWTKTDDVSFEFTHLVSDGDEGPWSFQCKLTGPSQAHDWQDCTSPRTYTDLEDTGDEAVYTFAVYAVDSGDSAINYVGDPLDPTDDETQPDADSASPATMIWGQDTEAPTLVVVGPYDSAGTGWPIVKQPKVSIFIDASEDPVDYRCQLGGHPVDCLEGRTRIQGLSGGDQVCTVTAEDPAGNRAIPQTVQFTVPYNLTGAKNWQRRQGKGYFARDYLQTRTPGARIRFRAQNIRRFRVIAPAAPKLGKIRVQVGDGAQKTIDLGRKDATKRRYYVVRDATSPLFSGRILVESLSRGKPVRVDALVFPAG